MDVTHAKLLIKFKWHSTDDPFCQPTTDKNNQQTFLHDSKVSTDTIGQITSYATAQLGSQFHACVYSILIIKDYVQLIRWDCTGAIVSKPIHYSDNFTLAEFFCQYHKTPAEVHSVNTTVAVLTDCEKLLAWKCLGLTEDVPFVKMTMPTDIPRMRQRSVEMEI